MTKCVVKIYFIGQNQAFRSLARLAIASLRSPFPPPRVK